jgi:hypothetical protein
MVCPQDSFCVIKEFANVSDSAFLCVFRGCVMFGLRAILLLAEGAVGAGVALVVVEKGLLKVELLTMRNSFRSVA